MYQDRYRFPYGSNFQRAPVSSIKDWPAILAGYRALGDRESRAIFRALLVYRYWSPERSAVANNKQLYDQLEAFMAADMPSEPLPGDPSYDGFPIRRWPVSFNGRKVEIDTIKFGTYWAVASDQYFFRRGDFYVGAEPSDTVLDCGAFIGDTALKFASYVGESGHVYSFDPMPSHVTLAREAVERNGFKNVYVYCCGVARSSRPDLGAALTTSALSTQAPWSPGHVLTENESTISIDDLARTLERPVDYIKMDIEGSEIDALAGAHETILRDRPKLAICLYHRPSDLWTIPTMIKRLYPFYDLRVGHHTLHLEETVLYARAR